jgi:transposase
MLNLAAATIFLGLEPTDMRKFFDTLATRVRDHLGGDLLSGSWFVFRNRSGDGLKILYWDGDGFAIWQKRLAKGAFEFPKVIGTTAGVAISATDLALILGGVALNAKRRKRYAPPTTAAG